MTVLFLADIGPLNTILHEEQQLRPLQDSVPLLLLSFWDLLRSHMHASASHVSDHRSFEHDNAVVAEVSSVFARHHHVAAHTLEHYRTGVRELLDLETKYDGQTAHLEAQHPLLLMLWHVVTTDDDVDDVDYHGIHHVEIPDRLHDEWYASVAKVITLCRQAVHLVHRYKLYVSLRFAHDFIDANLSL